MQDGWEALLSALIAPVMKLLFGFFAGTVAALGCLTQVGTGVAPESVPPRAEPASKGAAVPFAYLTSAAGQENPGTRHETALRTAEAFRSTRKAAERGDARAQAELGSIYKDENGAARDDVAAAAWYRKAADQGLARAQYDLGLMYATGRGMQQDFGLATAWYRKAADQRLAVAQFTLGYMYLKGRGVEQDLEQAARWYRKAAEQGEGEAQVNLALSYETGRGVRQDLVQAIEWLILATADGVPGAQQSLERLEHRATRAQIADAQALAGRWQRHVARAGRS